MSSPLSWRAIGRYAAPVAAVSFLENWIAFYFLKFATDVLLVSPAWVGGVFAVARVWDGVSDPLVGYLSDRTSGRFGRRRPWILAGGVLVGFVSVALWSPPEALGPRSLALWLGVAVVAFYTAQTLFEVPHLALGVGVAPGGHARTRLFAGRLGFGISGVIAAALCMGILRSGDDSRATASAIAWLGALVCWAGLAISLPGTSDARASAPAPSALRAFRSVLASRDARWVAGITFLEGLAFACLSTTMVFANEYWMRRPDLTPVLLLLAVGVIGISIPLWLPLAKRFGKLRVWRGSLAVRGAAFAALFFHPADASAGLFLGVLVIGASYGCGRLVAPAIKADIIEAEATRGGLNQEGTFFACWNLAEKAAAGLAVAISGGVLAVAGFEPNAEQTPEAILAIRIIFALLPAALCVLAAVGVGRLGRGGTEIPRADSVG